jgi:hypothetical protein
LSIGGPVDIPRRVAETKSGMNIWGERLTVITPVSKGSIEGSIFEM